MFFEKDAMSFNIMDVFLIDQENINMFNSGRNFNAIAFRYHADTIIKTDKSECHLKDHYVSYIPARLDYTRISTKDKMIAVNFETTNYHTKNIEYFESKNPDILADLFKKMLECWEGKKVGYKLKCSAILYEIFAECYVQNYEGDPKISRINPSIEYIHQNYKEKDITIKDIADKSFVSEVYFRKLFREEFGISPQKYIINLRIQNASGLISTGYYSLKEVAYMSGYNDYKYFSVEFKRVMGVSPSDYLYNYHNEKN